MPKRTLSAPATHLAPLPAVLVTCRAADGFANLLTIAWAGIVCSEPPLLSVSIRPGRFSHGIIRETGEFAVNVPPASLARQVDLCGVTSGREGDKWARAGLTPVPASRIQAPLVGECRLALECRVIQILPLGSHDLFLGEIVAVTADEEALDPKGRLLMDKVDPLGYAAPDHSYRGMGKALGSYGFAKKG